MNTISNLLPESITTTADLAAKENEKSNEIGQNEFLDLMLAQLKNQDPFQPLENGEFVAQMAQFSTVSGIEEMNASLKGMSESLRGDRLLDASSLIGRTALVSSNTASLTQEGLNAIYRLEEDTTNIKINVYSNAGEVVHQKHIAQQPHGQHKLHWNGESMTGDPLPEGTYSLEVTYGNTNEQSTADLFVPSTISSVSAVTGNNDLMLETEQGLRIALQDIETLQ